jgi:hypothetical protein
MVSTLVRCFTRLLVSLFAVLAVLGSAYARSGYKKSFNVGSSRLTLKPLQKSNQEFFRKLARMFVRLGASPRFVAGVRCFARGADGGIRTYVFLTTGLLAWTIISTFNQSDAPW